jgi:hypothetical protein
MAMQKVGMQRAAADPNGGCVLSPAVPVHYSVQRGWSSSPWFAGQLAAAITPPFNHRNASFTVGLIGSAQESLSVPVQSTSSPSRADTSSKLPEILYAFDI